jgi:hypothetical protein
VIRLAVRTGAIRALIEGRVKGGKKPTTIKRYVATIARVHVAAGLLNPCSSEAVRLGLKKMGRETLDRQDQAHPLGWRDTTEFIDSAAAAIIRNDPIPEATQYKLRKLHASKR